MYEPFLSLTAANFIYIKHEDNERNEMEVNKTLPGEMN